MTGKPVHMEEDRSLPVISHIQIARGPVPMHKLRYRPTPDGTPDYHICFQCGFIIRLYENPPEQRYDFEGSPDAPARMASLLKGNPAASQLKDMLLGGLMTQLRSMPIGMRIDDWLFHECPELRWSRKPKTTESQVADFGWVANHILPLVCRPVDYSQETSAGLFIKPKQTL